MKMVRSSIQSEVDRRSLTALMRLDAVRRAGGVRGLERAGEEGVEEEEGVAEGGGGAGGGEVVGGGEEEEVMCGTEGVEESIRS